MSDIIERFVRQYRREVDFFDEAARLVHGQLEAALSSSGVRAIVSYRAKSPDRLKEKLLQRQKKRQKEQKPPYSDFSDIYEDIVDLAGVRIAIYFTSSKDEVEKIIRDNFLVIEKIDHPKKKDNSENESQDSNSSNDSYLKRFSGYHASHFRARLLEDSLLEAQFRYTEAQVEIQVASVLMHAWSEVEHDLIYKPLQGKLSIDEYAILDELNGLVIAGEIALENLKRAENNRVTRNGNPFGNHYELAAFLIEKSGKKSVTPGRIDVLFQFLLHLGLETPNKIHPYIDALNRDFEDRPITDQIADYIIGNNNLRLKDYLTIRKSTQVELESSQNDSIEIDDSFADIFGRFITDWMSFQSTFLSLLKEKNEVENEIFNIKTLVENHSGLTEEYIKDFQTVRNIKNNALHDSKRVSTATLAQAISTLKRIQTALHTNEKPTDFLKEEEAM